MDVYIKTTKDKYELPVVVADSVKECARLSGMSYSSVAAIFSRIRNGKGSQRGWQIIRIDDYDENEGLTITDIREVEEYEQKRIAEELKGDEFICPVCGRIKNVSEKSRLGDKILCNKCRIKHIRSLM